MRLSIESDSPATLGFVVSRAGYIKSSSTRVLEFPNWSGVYDFVRARFTLQKAG